MDDHLHGKAPLTGVERTFDKRDFIVSKTDLKGRITYGNRLFFDMAGYTARDLIGAPHSIIRHPDMPRCVFKLLWDTIQAKREIFAYVVNRAAGGDHYWVHAHVTPTFDEQRSITGYHSNRRAPDMGVVNGTIIPLYKNLLAIEASVPSRKDGMNKGFDAMVDVLNQRGLSYDEFVFSLSSSARNGGSGGG